MLRIYVREPIEGRTTKTDDVAKMQYIEIDVQPLTPVPINMDGIKPENVRFVTFFHKFIGDMQCGLYRSGRKNTRCEAHVTRAPAPYDRQVILKAPTFDLAKKMWTCMCSTDKKNLKPYRKM
ncbi:MAG: hypothetical protein KGH79_02975 [Patescibacteria group bacterium]|nr:hypothetical protein [Patescibacteria group bacterium]